MNIKERLIAEATAHNEAVAIEKAKLVYESIVDKAMKVAKMGQYDTVLLSKDFPELYRATMGNHDEVRRRMIEILRDKFKEDGLFFEFIGSGDTFGEDYYKLSWYKE